MMLLELDRHRGVAEAIERFELPERTGAAQIRSEHGAARHNGDAPKPFPDRFPYAAWSGHRAPRPEALRRHL
jgi:hypothetical protein